MTVTLPVALSTSTSATPACRAAASGLGVGAVALEHAGVQAKADELVGQRGDGHLLPAAAHGLAVELHVLGVHAEDAGRLLANLADEVLGRAHDGAAGGVGAGGRVGAGVEGGGVGVHALSDDAVHVAAERLGRHLGEDGVRAGAHVGGTDGEHVEAVVLETDVNVGDVHHRDAGALHREGHAQAAHAVAEVLAQGPVLPAHHLHRAPEALVEAAAVEMLVVQLPEGLAGLDQVLEAQLARVHAQLVCHLVDGGLHGKAALRRAVAAVGAARRGVGVDHVVAKAARRGVVVDRQRLAAHERDRGSAVVAVGAGVGEGVEVDGLDRAVAPGAHADLEDHLVARVGAVHGLLARVGAHARATGLHRGERGEGLVAAALLGAKSAAHARLMTRTWRLGMPRAFATWRRMWKGTCVELTTVRGQRRRCRRRSGTSPSWTAAWPACGRFAR